MLPVSTFNRKLLAANWKMNLTLSQAQGLASEVLTMATSENISTRTVLCVPAPFLWAISHLTKDYNEINVGAQNLSEAVKGAFTGETSGAMIKSCGANYVIIGHSERRRCFGEKGKLLQDKILRAIENELVPIYCIGETAEEKSQNLTETVIKRQFNEAVENLDADNVAKIVWAYEPVWAIGTGVSASPTEAQTVHSFLRGLLNQTIGKEKSENVSILYGGSVTPETAPELFKQPDVDGALVGGASLDARAFIEIARALQNV